MNTTSLHHSVFEIAHAIADRYAHLKVGEDLSYAKCLADATATPSFAELSLHMQGIKLGCRLLGFVEHDAQCIMLAWQSQTQRLGSFDISVWPSNPSDFGMSSFPRKNAFAPCPNQLGLYAVLPDAQWVYRMAQAGVPTVQLRFKSDDKAAIAKEVAAAVTAVQGTNSLLFINDHWQEAIAAGAYGVHLGQEDMQEASLEKIRTAGLRLGLSTHGYAEMLLADRHSPSYMALGAVFPTTLKRMVTAPQGLGRLERYAQLMKAYPLVAIGGIDLEQLPAVVKTGVGSVAVVRAIIASESPEATAQAFLLNLL
ncbi:MAG: thiamine phosphate synthase [Burkholderiales bacterium]|nr:thiamine phosphate synthase [Burkholderiales bacterium]